MGIYDQMLAQYENPQNFQSSQSSNLGQNPQQQPTQINRKGVVDIIALENQFTTPSKLQSMSVLKFDIGYINQNVMPNQKKNPEIANFYKNLVSELQQQLSTITQNIKDEKIQELQYMKMVNTTLQEEQLKLTVATSVMKNRIGLRCRTLQQELEGLKNNKFDKICQQFGCGPDAAQKFLFQGFQEKPFKEKAKELLIRHKEYLNLTQYLSTHMKEEKREFIEFLIGKLEKSKVIQNDLKEGKNIDYSKFFISEFKEITEDQFLGISKIEYQEQIQNMLDQVNQAYKEEQLYYKVASLAKPNVQIIPGTKQIESFSPADICKQYFVRYEEFLKYLLDQKNASWTPLPILKMEAENREISTVNNDVQNDMLRIQFKNFINDDKLESINKKKTVLTAQILKTYPKFDKISGLDQYLEQKLKEIPNEPMYQQKQQIQQPQQQQQENEEKEEEEEVEDYQGPQLQPDQLILLDHQEMNEEFINVKKISEKMPQLQEDLLNPENPQKGSVYYFLVQYAPFLQQKSVELRHDPSQKQHYRFVQKLYEDCITQQNKLKNKLINDMEGYFSDLQQIIQKDQLIIKLYKQAQAPTWSKFVEGRLEIALQEEKAIQEQL